MEAWDVVVLGDTIAGLRAASESSAAGATTLLLSSTALGHHSHGARDGIAAGLQEANNRGHREDTVRAGGFLSDQDVVSTITASAIGEVDFLERKGVIFHRDQKGLPKTRHAVGHHQPRLIDSGDSTSLEVHQVLEEQAMKFGVVRRGDHIPLHLVLNDTAVEGLIVLDSMNGTIVPIQCKALVIADQGFEGAFSAGPIGLGMDMAFRAGLALRDMEHVLSHPLYIKGTNVALPFGLLSDGATLHEASGPELSTAETDHTSLCQVISSAVQPVLDARHLGENKVWWSSTFDMVKMRTGIDMNRSTVPLECRVDFTIGGLPIDSHGRCVVGTWSRWATGLYAAGDAASSGFHGAGLLVGNRMLDAMVIGAAAGRDAGTWVQSRSFASSKLLQEATSQVEADMSAMMVTDEEKTHALRIGNINASIRSSLAATKEMNAASLSQLKEELEALSHQAESLHLDQTSLMMNTNLHEVLCAQASIRMLAACTIASLAREESRGQFSRSDFASSSNDFLYHITVNIAGETGRLALKKGAGGHWILAPQED
jgi:succinate dehydrogenase / fumarate reductase flavoprotein subunit